MTFEDFVNYHKENGRFPNGIYSTKGKELNEAQYKTKYQKYLSLTEKQELKRQEQIEKNIQRSIDKAQEEDVDWLRMREKVYERDSRECRLFSVLTQDEKEQFGENFGWKWKYIITPAHIFKVGSNLSIKYLPEYVVTLNLASHGMLDAGKCPISGKAIEPDEVEWWWKRIAGIEQYEQLKERLNG